MRSGSVDVRRLREQEMRYGRRPSAISVRYAGKRSFIMIGVLFTVMMCWLFTVKAFANTDRYPDDKQYKSIMIHCNDTVESIAKEWGSSCFMNSEKMADEIRSINGLSYDEHLIPGNYLVIPYYISK